MRKKIFKTIKFLLSLFIAFILLYYIIRSLDLNILLEYIKEMDYFLILLSYIITLISFILRGIRWSDMLKAVKISLGYLVAIKYYSFSIIVSTFFPMRAGDLLRIGLIRKTKGFGYKKSAFVVLFERILDALSLGLFGLVSVYITYTLYNLILPQNIFQTFFYISLFLLFALIIVILFLRTKLLDKFIFIPRKLFPKIYMRLNLESFFPILRNDISNKKYGYFFLLSVIIWFIEIFATYLMALALSIDVSIFIIFIVYFLIGFSMVLVLTPGNLGISEYIFVLILSLFNISPELSLALALVDRLVKSFTFFSLAFFSYNFIKSKDNIIASISDTKQSD